MAKQSNFPDNVHVGSPEHDRMVCEISQSFLFNHVPFIREFMSDRDLHCSIYTSGSYGTGYEARKLFEKCPDLWTHIKGVTIPAEILDSKESREALASIQSEYLNLKPPALNTLKIEYELPVLNATGSSYKTIVGYWDAKVTLVSESSSGSHLQKYYNSPEHRRCFIEVKPKIESFGALLRQLNLYREYSESGPIYVYTPDLRFIDQLHSQGIGVIEAKAPESYKGLMI